MADEKAIAKFGRKEISSNGTAKLNDLVEEARELRSSEFDEKLRVEGVKSTVDRDKNAPNYQRLDMQTSKTIDVFFKGISKSEYEKYMEQPQNEGISSGGEPFKCYVEMNGDGNIIVTPTKLIQVKNEDKENGEYSETRKNEDGSIATVKLTKTHGDITGCHYSRRGNITEAQEARFNKLEEYYSDPNNIQKMELAGKSEQEKIEYIQTLQKLGIKLSKYGDPKDMTKEQYEQAKAEGKMVRVRSCSSYSKNDEFKIGNSIYDSQDKPLEVSFVSYSKNDRENFKVYKRTADGRYFDSSSYRIENGKPVFDLLDYSEILQEMNEYGIPARKFDQMNDKVENDLGNEFPKEAEKIAAKSAKAKSEQDQDRDQDEEDKIPGERQ